MISLNSSLEKMIGFELAQYVSTRQSSLLLPGFSCSQGWDRGQRGFLGRDDPWAAIEAGRVQAPLRSCWNTISAFIEIWQLVKICPCSLNIFPLLFVNKQKMFPGPKCGGWGAWGEEESRKSVGRTERRGKPPTFITRAQDVLFYLQ